MDKALLYTTTVCSEEEKSACSRFGVKKAKFSARLMVKYYTRYNQFKTKGAAA
jgi:hypothetical protein